MSHSIGIGVIGMGWMGHEHSRAYHQIQHRYPKIPLKPKLIMCSDEVKERAEDAKNRFGFKHASDNWTDVIDSDEIQLVCITTPNHLHQEMVAAAAKAGKHISIEKPVGQYPHQTLAIAESIRNAKVNSAIGFTYRWPPLVQHIKAMVSNGKLGRIAYYRGHFLADYGSDANGVLSWRFNKEIAGLGASGDLLTHVIDMAIHLNGDIKEVCAKKNTFIKYRPYPTTTAATHFDKGTTSKSAKVTNEDTCIVLAEHDSGLQSVLEASRVTYGTNAFMAFEVYGSEGSVKWNFKNMNEMEIVQKSTESEGFASVQSGFSHPDHRNFSPDAGIGLSFSDIKCIEIAHFLQAISDNRPFEPGIEDMVKVANTLQAVITSCESNSWQTVTPIITT